MEPPSNGDAPGLYDTSLSVELERPVAAFLFCLSGLVVFLGSILILVISSASFSHSTGPSTSSSFPEWSFLVVLAVFGLIFIIFPISLAFWFILGLYREPRLHRQIGLLVSIISAIWLTVFVPVLLQTMIVHAQDLVRDTGFNDPTIRSSVVGMVVGPILIVIGGLWAIAWKPMNPVGASLVPGSGAD